MSGRAKEWLGLRRNGDWRAGGDSQFGAVQDFRHLRMWQRAHALAIAIHKLARPFGRAGYGHLRTQLCKAADSIESNIVEGCGADSNKEFARFLDMSIKSANETEFRLLSACDLDLISPDDWHKHTAETIEIRKMIYGYRKKLLRSPRKGPRKGPRREQPDPPQ